MHQSVLDEPLRHRLASDDRELADLVGELWTDLRLAKQRCSQARWGSIEQRLLDRIEAEEALLLPTLGCAHPASVALIHQIHADLRYLLADVRVEVDAGTVSAEHVEGLVRLLAQLIARKETHLYPFVDEVDDTLVSLFVRRLAQSSNVTEGDCHHECS